MIHDFKTSLEKVLPEELRLDAYLESKEYTVTNANIKNQRRGIDRFIEKRLDGAAVEYTREAIEYKVDYRAGKTGNAYIETVSVSFPFKQGWVYTCQADWILYTIISDDSYVLWLRPKEIKKCTPYWTEHYRTVKCINRDYWGEGILVPLHVLKKLAEKEESLDDNRS